MAILFMDSFDHYAVADILSKYDDHSAAETINASGRFGSCLQCASTNHGVQKNITGSPTTLFAGVAFYAGTALATTARIFQFREAATVHVDVRPDAGGHLTVTRNGTLLGTGSAVLSFGTWYYIEFKATIHDSAGAALLKLYPGGTTEVNVSGVDTRNGGTGIIDNVRLEDFGGGGTASQQHRFDDFYIGDTTGSAPTNDLLGDVRVEALLPSGAGNSAQFTPSAGSNYQNVDDATADGDTTYNYSSTVNQLDTFAMGNITAAAGTVFSVQSNLYARKDDAGSRSVAPVFRISSTDYVGSNAALSTNYRDERQVYDVSPATSSAWTVSEINGMEAGYKLTV